MWEKMLVMLQWLMPSFLSLSFGLVWWINYSSTLEFFQWLFISIFVFTAANHVATAELGPLCYLKLHPAKRHSDLLSAS